MLAWHYATALIAHQKFPKGSLIFFLILSQLQDLLWFVFHYLGLETTLPSDVFGATLVNMSVDMLYSHDLLPLICWMLIAFLIGRFYYKSNMIGLVGTALIAGHFVLDFFSGHPHHVFWEETHAVGFGLYESNIYLAIAIEAIFIIGALWYFFREETKQWIERTIKNKATIIAMFVYGVGFMLFIATTSMRDWFGIPNFNLGFNTNMPTLIFMYIGMIAYLNYFVSQKKIT